MHGVKPAGVRVLLAALLLAVSASPAVGSYGGRIVFSHGAAAGSTRASAHLHTALEKLVRRLEDDVAPELSWAASLQAQGIGTGALDKSRQVCLHHVCSVPGHPYTGRGCKNIYGCPTAPTQSNS